MSFTKRLEAMELASREGRSHSAQGLTTLISSPCTKFPQPPRLWITDISDDTTDDSDNVVRDELVSTERSRVRSRFRHHKQRSSAPVPVPIGIFWDIENCQVPRGCSAIDVVSAIRAKFLTCRREADFVVVCDVRKESAIRLQELNDAQVSLIHVCGTQKNAADEKLRQCMRRFGELHTAPASLLLISGDINFAADLSDFRHRKNMEVILVHKQNTSSALITCATTNYCFNDLTANLPRNSKVICQEEEEPTCEVEVLNLPIDQPPERVSRRLRRLGDNCGGKVLKVTAPTATLRFPSIDHASRALKRMEGEDVFGCKIGTRYVRNACQPAVHAYSSDEGYATATQLPRTLPQQSITPSAVNEWALALQQLPIPPAASRPQSGGALNCSGPPRNLYSPQVRAFCPPASKPRKIRGIHGSSKTEQSGCSSGNSGDDSRQDPESRAISPWNSSASFSEPSSEGEANEPTAELTVSNLPALEPKRLQEMLTLLISQYVPVVRVSVWVAGEGPIATVMFRSEWDARLVIARLHKRRLDSVWTGRRLELSLGRPSPAPNLDVLRARLRAILLEQKSNILPLLRLRDAYASRHCCALTTSDIAKVKDTVIIHEGLGRMVQLIDLSPVTSAEMEEAPWKCHVHAAMSTGHDDGSRILSPVYMEVEVLAKQTQILLENHGGILPLLSFVECYEATFSPLPVDVNRGVALELLLRSVPGLLVVDMPSRHITRKDDRHDTQSPTSQFSDSGSVCVRERPRTAPALEPMLSLFEREVIDLLRTAPKCCIPFSKLIPAFHHHFGRQCRVADYGFTKLPDLLAALSSTIVILGSGSSRVITISGAAQSRRWTSDLIKVLRSQSGRSVYPHELPALYQAACGRPFATQHYGVCTLRELMARVAPGTVICSSDGSISLPRRAPTPDERARVSRFAVEAVELLCYTPNLRMEFSRLVPAYHAHFGRQLRVAHYGCVKLAELFEMMPEAVSLTAEGGAERVVKVAEKAARAVVAKRLRSLGPLPVVALSGAYSAQFGAPPLPDMLGCAASLQQLVVAAGGAIEGGLALPPGTCAGHVSSRLTAAAVLAADRSVTARGSSDEYFARAFQRASGRAPDMRALQWANVIIVSVQGRVQLTPAWRTVWRLAQLLANAGQPLSAQEMHCQYLERYEPVFPCHELGFESVLELVRYFQEVFNELPNQRFSLCPGVAVMDGRVEPQPEITLQDTPPGQKGSRVFESPMTNIWCSPPASALPAPSALFFQDAKRRTRLAAQFNAA